MKQEAAQGTHARKGGQGGGQAAQPSPAGQRAWGSVMMGTAPRPMGTARSASSGRSCSSSSAIISSTLRLKAEPCRGGQRWAGVTVQTRPWSAWASSASKRVARVSGPGTKPHRERGSVPLTEACHQPDCSVPQEPCCQQQAGTPSFLNGQAPPPAHLRVALDALHHADGQPLALPTLAGARAAQPGVLQRLQRGWPLGMILVQLRGRREGDSIPGMRCSGLLSHPRKARHSRLAVRPGLRSCQVACACCLHPRVTSRRNPPASLQSLWPRPKCPPSGSG